MTTFVLIHGGSHVGAHWSSFRPHLVARGHRTLAPDVPLDRVDSNLDDWADVVVEAIDASGADEDVVIVGHSMGGLVVPIVASRRPVKRMVFLCSLLPTPGVSWNDYLAEHPEASTLNWDRVVVDEQGRMTFPFDLMRDAFYQDCDLESARSAYSLVVPCATTGLEQPCPIDAWPATPSTFVLCQDDKLIPADWMRSVASQWSDAPAIELPGGHSPMMSRPELLAEVLDRISQQS